MNNSPCKDCPNRRIACHAHCEIYADYRKTLDAVHDGRIEYYSITRMPVKKQQAIRRIQYSYYGRRRH